MSKKVKYDINDVLLLTDGNLAKVLEFPGYSDCVIIQYVNKTECTYIEPQQLKVDQNLGQDWEVLMSFHATRSIHIRLNRMNQV